MKKESHCPKDCLVKTRLDYFNIEAETQAVKIYYIKNPIQSAFSIAKIKRNGQFIPEIYRLERGSINRYIYCDHDVGNKTQIGNRLENNHWNKKLIYLFKGVKYWV